MWPKVELREIRTFLTLAEELHFGRTARRLGITPSRVSQTTRTLETRIGSSLFHRTSRRVSLTAYGSRLAAGLRPAYDELVAVLDAAAAHANETAGALRVGVTVNTDRPSIHHILSVFRRVHPECQVSIQEVDIWEPYTPLRRGEIDVLCNWLAVEEPDLTVGPVIERYERILAVGRGHRLAARRSVTSEDLAGERLNRAPRRYPKALTDAILVPRTRSGRPIRRTDHELESVPEVVAMIARGEIVNINQRGTVRFERQDIVLIPITDLPPLPLGLIWCTRAESARIRAFARIAANPSIADPSREHHSELGAGHSRRHGVGADAVELAEIRAFLVVSDELHFGRAAERLLLTPSRVSQIIRKLETKLGAGLFERTSRRTQLTPFGTQLRERLAPACAGIQTALQIAPRNLAKPAGLLRIGFSTTTESPVLSRLLTQFRAQHPECEVTLHETEIFDPYGALRGGEVDVLHNFLPVGEPDLVAGPVLARYDPFLAVAAGHRLAGADSVSIEDLADEQLARVPSTFPKALHDVFLPPLLPSGRPIRLTHPVQTMNEILSLVAQGRIVWPVAGRSVTSDRDDIVRVPLRDGAKGVVGLVWRAGHETASIRALADIARSLEPETTASIGRAPARQAPHRASARTSRAEPS